MKTELRARPLALLLGGLLIGLVFPSYSWLFAIGIGVGIIYKERLIWVVSLGIFLAVFLSLWRAPVPTLSAGEFRGRIEIHSFPNFNRGKNLYSFETLDSPKQTGILRLDPAVAASPFAILEVAGRANETKTGSLSPTEVKVISRWPIFDWMVRLQRSAIQRTNELYGREDGAWVTALTFNFPSDLSSEEKQNLRFNGTYHMVSASGMHVYVIALLLHWILMQFGIGRHWQILTVFAVLLLYCGMTGFHAPTLRASMMWLVVASAYLFRRSPDGLSALCLSALVWLAFVPSDAFTAGFQLSYIVSGCLLMWFERMRFVGMKKRLLFEAPLVAAVASEPLAAWWFGQILFVSPISNLLIEFPSSAVMILGFASMIPYLGLVAVYIAKPMIWWMQWVTSWTSAVPLVFVTRYSVSPLVLVAYYLFLLWLLLGRMPERRRVFE